MGLRLKLFRTPEHSLALILSSIYIGSFALDSPVRYSLSLVNLSAAIYLRDLIAPALLLILMLKGIKQKTWPKTAFVISAILASHTILGIIFLDSVAQALFGMKVYLPLLGGALVGHMIISTRPMPTLGNVFLVIWLVCLLGVFAEAVGINFPWKGFEVDVAGRTVQGNKQWTTGGIDRLAGFGRASFDTALLLLLLPLIAIPNRPFILRTSILLLSTIGIILTTSKSATLASIIILCTHFLFSIKIPGRAILGNLIVIALCAATILAPTLLNPAIIKIDGSNPVVYVLFASFMDRILNTWPVALDLLGESPIPFLGRGIGGIGVAQSYFEPLLYSPADNLFVHTLVTFGAPGVFYIGLILKNGLRPGFALTSERITRVYFFAAIFAIGISINFVESATSLFLLGILLPRRNTDNHVATPEIRDA